MRLNESVVKYPAAAWLQRRVWRVDHGRQIGPGLQHLNDRGTRSLRVTR